jgi:hypothetical protein
MVRAKFCRGAFKRKTTITFEQRRTLTCLSRLSTRSSMSSIAVRAVATSVVVLVVGANGAAAKSTPPRILKVSSVDATRVVPKKGSPYFSLSAVVKLNRSLTSADRQGGGFGLIGSLWATRRNLDRGTQLPDELFGGTSLGRVGRAGAHCYRAEVAQLNAHRTVRPGRPWRIALHDGQTVLRLAPRTILVKNTSATEAKQIRKLGC